MRFASSLAVLLVAVVPVRGGAQARAEIIRGRIMTDSGAALGGATVSATMAPDRNCQQATTDAAGRYVLRFERGRRIPFRITVDVTIDLGVPLEKQQAVRLLDPGRRRAGVRLPADTIAVRFARWMPDIYRAIASHTLAAMGEHYDADAPWVPALARTERTPRVGIRIISF